MNSLHKDYDPEALKASFVMVGIDYAAPSPTNPRKSFPEAEMAELIESVKQHGVLQPILVRHWPLAYAQPGPLVTYEIVAGERRWRAAKAAGLTMLEGKLRELTDLEVLEIQIIENLQRADLHPLEEAEGYERIMSTHAYTAEQLGAKIGKSRSYIFARLKLLALDDDARRLFRAGLLNPSTALLVARIPTASLRAKAIKEITETNYQGDAMSVRAAQRLIQQRFMLKLVDAPFPLGDATLTQAGSCETCPKRTGNVPDLFEDIESPDVCTDPDCFVEKKIAHRDREAEKARAAGAVVILGDEAKKIAGSYGIESYTTLKGYTQLDAKCYEDPEKRTYGEILGDDIEQVLLEDAYKQVMVPVIPNNILAEKLQAAGVKLRAEEEAKGAARVEAKLKLERATRARMFEMVRDNVGELAKDDGGFAFPVQEHLFTLIVLRLWERLGFDVQAIIANLWGTSGKNNTERIAAFAVSIPQMNVVDCWKLATDTLFASSTHVTSEWDLEHGGKQLIALATAKFDIDLTETRKFVQDELKAKEKEAKPVKKTGKKAKSGTSAEPPYPSEAARAADLSRENAAQAGDQAPEENQATPSARADIIEMVETPTELAIEEAQPTEASEQGIVETDETPPEIEGQSGDLIQVGTCVKVRSTSKNWRMAGQVAQILAVVKPGRYKAKYGPNICDWSLLDEADILSQIPAHDGAQIPTWAIVPSASAGTGDPPAGDRAFKPDDVVRVLPDATNQEGFFLYHRGKEGVIDAIYTNGDIEVSFVGGDAALFLPENLEHVSPPNDRCDKTVDMFQEQSA